MPGMFQPVSLRVYTPLGHLLTQAPEKCQQLSGYGSRHQTSPEVALSLEAETSVEICQDSPGLVVIFIFTLYNPNISGTYSSTTCESLQITRRAACGHFLGKSLTHFFYLSKKSSKRWYSEYSGGFP